MEKLYLVDALLQVGLVSIARLFVVRLVGAHPIVGSVVGVVEYALFRTGNEVFCPWGEAKVMVGVGGRDVSFLREVDGSSCTVELGASVRFFGGEWGGCVPVSLL